MTTRYRKCCRCKLNRNVLRYVGKRGRICDTCRKTSSSESARNRRLREVYEVTPDEWAKVLELQGNVCGGCKQPRSYRLQVDHDHKVERELGMRASLRGALCRRCNKALRDLRDSIENLEGLAAFLRDPPARKILSGTPTRRVIR